MKKAIRKVTYKMKPSVSQEESLMDLFVHHHQLYNWALRDRIETYIVILITVLTFTNSAKSTLCGVIIVKRMAFSMLMLRVSKSH